MPGDHSYVARIDFNRKEIHHAIRACCTLVAGNEFPELSGSRGSLSLVRGDRIEGQGTLHVQNPRTVPDGDLCDGRRMQPQPGVHPPRRRAWPPSPRAALLIALMTFAD